MILKGIVLVLAQAWAQFKIQSQCLSVAKAKRQQQLSQGEIDDKKGWQNGGIINIETKGEGIFTIDNWFIY